MTNNFKKKPAQPGFEELNVTQLQEEIRDQGKLERKEQSDQLILAKLGHLKDAPLGECLQNQLWRICHLYKIIDKDGDEVQFRPNYFQMAFLGNLWYFNIILKARQLGFSTLIDILALDSALFNKTYRAGIIAHDLESAKKLFADNIEYPYNHLPETIRAWRKPASNTVRSLEFANDSEVRVATSLRSGTNQFLHISEFGKICAKSYEKSREVVTGSIETVGQGNICIIESTAEGQGGFFYDYCQKSENDMLSKRQLGMQDYKFFFFPWYEEKTYRADPDLVVMTEEDNHYFDALEESLNTELTQEQRAWYVLKRHKLQDDMKREYPSSSSEAFEAAVKGTYLGNELRQLREGGRVRKLTHEPNYPVYTFWDIGMDDYTAIWVMQYVMGEFRFLKYYENNDLGVNHYASWLTDQAIKNGWLYGEHYLPHDIRVRDWSNEGQSRQEVLENLGIAPITVVESPPNSFGDQIQACRDRMARCWFDEEGCALGVQRLGGWSKKFNQTDGVFKESEKHDQNSHGGGAFRMFAFGFGEDRARGQAGFSKSTSGMFGWKRPSGSRSARGHRRRSWRIA